MGSKFAPMLCSAIALQREWIFHSPFSPLTWDRSLHHRYVDNRTLLISRHNENLPSVQSILDTNILFFADIAGSCTRT